MVSLIALVSVGAIVLTEMESTSYTDTLVEDEVDQPSSTLPTNYTLDASTNSDYVEVKDNTVDVVLEDSSAGSNVTLTEGTDYEAYYQDGKVELKSSPGGVTYDDTSDKVYTTYEYESEGTATDTLGQGQDALSTYADFFVVIVVVAVASVIFLLLGGLRKAGNKSMA